MDIPGLMGLSDLGEYACMPNLFGRYEWGLPLSSKGVIGCRFGF